MMHVHDENCCEVHITGGIAIMPGSEPATWQGRVMVKLEDKETEFAWRGGFSSKEKAQAWIERESQEVKVDMIYILGEPNEEITVKKWEKNDGSDDEDQLGQRVSEEV